MEQLTINNSRFSHIQAFFLNFIFFNLKVSEINSIYNVHSYLFESKIYFCISMEEKQGLLLCQSISQLRHLLKFQAAVKQNLQDLQAPNEEAFRNFFNEAYEFRSNKNYYSKIIMLIEASWQSQKIKRGRQVEIITIWLHYQLFLVKQEEDFQQTKLSHSKQVFTDILKKELDLQNIKSLQLLSDFESEYLFENICNSPIRQDISDFFQIKISQIIKRLFISQKAQQRHDELVDISEGFKNGSGIIQCQLYRHILLQFERHYEMVSPEGQDAQKFVIPITSLIQLIRKSNRMTGKAQIYFRQFLQPLTSQNKKYSLLQKIKLELIEFDIFSFKRSFQLSLKSEDKQERKNRLQLLLNNVSKEQLNRRRCLLETIIVDNLGIANGISYFYYKQLTTLNKCTQMEEKQFEKIKETIKKKGLDELLMFEKKVQQLKLPINFNQTTIQQLEEIKIRIQSLEIFRTQLAGEFIQKGFVAKEIQNLIDQAFKRIKSDNQNIPTVKTIVRIFHFFNNYRKEKLVMSYATLEDIYIAKKQELINTLDQICAFVRQQANANQVPKETGPLQSKFLALSNVLEGVLETFTELKVFAQHLKKENGISEQQQLNELKITIRDKFDTLIKEVTGQCKKTGIQLHQQIDQSTIRKLLHLSRTFDCLGSRMILKRINPRKFREVLTSQITVLLQRLISQTKVALKCYPRQTLETRKLNIIKANALNIKKITRQFQDVFKIVDPTTNHLWEEIPKLIYNETFRMRQLIHDIKQGNQPNQKSLESFLLTIETIIEITSESNQQDLQQYIEDYKFAIKQQIEIQVNEIEQNMKLVNYSLSFSNNFIFDIKEMGSKIQCFKLIDSFCNMKGFREIIKFIQSKKSSEEKDDIESLTHKIQRIHGQIFQRLTKPFNQIFNLTSKYSSLSNIPSKFWEKLDNFLYYRKVLTSKLILHKFFIEKLAQITKQKMNFKSKLSEIISETKIQMNQIKNSNFLYHLQAKKLINFKAIVINMVEIKDTRFVQPYFQQEKYQWDQDYIEEINHIFTNVFRHFQRLIQSGLQSINKEYSRFRSSLRQLKQLDTFNFNGSGIKSYRFGQLYNRLQQIALREIYSLKYKLVQTDGSLNKIQIVRYYRQCCKGEIDSNYWQLSQHLRRQEDRLKSALEGKKDNHRDERKGQFKEEQLIIFYIEALNQITQYAKWLATFLTKQDLKEFTIRQYVIRFIKEENLSPKIRNWLKELYRNIEQYNFVCNEQELKRKQIVIQKLRKVEQFIRNQYKLIEESIGQALEIGLLHKNQNALQDLRAIYWFQQKQIPSFHKIVQTKLNVFYDKLSKQLQYQINLKIKYFMEQKFKEIRQSLYETTQRSRQLKNEVKQILMNLPKALAKQYQNTFQDTTTWLANQIQKQIQSLKRKLNQTNKIEEIVDQYESQKKKSLKEKCQDFFTKKLEQSKSKILQKSEYKSLRGGLKVYLSIFGKQNEGCLRKIQNEPKLLTYLTHYRRQMLTVLKSRVIENISKIQKLLDDNERIKQNELGQICESVNSFMAALIQHQCPDLKLRESEAIFSQWKGHLQKVSKAINRHIKDELPYPINQNPNQCAIYNKYLQQLRLFNICAQSFFKQTQQLQEKLDQFLKDFLNQIKSLKIAERINMIESSAKQSLIEITESLQTYPLYGNFSRETIPKDIQAYIERSFLSNLKIIKNYEEFYNKHLMGKGQSRLSQLDQKAKIQKRWQQTVTSAIKSFEQQLNTPNMEISEEITIIYNLSKIIYKNDWKMLDKNLSSMAQIEAILDKKVSNADQALLEHKRTIIQISYKMIQCEELINSARNDRPNQRKNSGNANILEVQNVIILSQQQIQKNLLLLRRQKQQFEKGLNQYLKTQVIQNLVKAKKLLCYMNWKDNKLNKTLSTFFNELKEIRKGLKQILYEHLDKSQNPYALMIVETYDIFKSKAVQAFIQKTKGQDLKYVLTNCPQINSNPAVNKYLEQFYNIYEEQYNRHLQQFLKRPDEQKLKKLESGLISYKQRNANDISPPQLIAQVFSLWSMMKADASDAEGISINFVPHPAQIVAIALLIKQKQEQNRQTRFNNIMVQVLTGEGKSIVLAGLCCYLALNGYSAYCACYSSYLSQRDDKSFRELFRRLQVGDKIVYGTINEHCQNVINSKYLEKYQKDIREYIKQIILQQNTENKAVQNIYEDDMSKSAKKILIIDEADAFFNEKHFGKFYNLSITLKSKAIENLLESIWRWTQESRNETSLPRLTKKQIMESNQFKELIEQYPTLQRVLQIQVNGLLKGAYGFEHSYIVNEQEIKYPSSDGITNKISQGYTTVFANCFEFQRKRISETAYKNALKLTLCAAPFSYSELPRCFQAILGVSGTINSMPPNRKEILKNNYNINEFYELPSIYGQSHLSEDQFSVVADQQYYSSICEKAMDVIEEKRPVIIFFNTKQDIEKLYRSEYFKKIAKYSTNLSEETAKDDRQLIINRAGINSKITILTKPFTRGMDIKVFEKSVNQAGGLHVIQACVPLSESEYKQARGRTARQGNRGSYQMILGQSDLKSLSQFDFDDKKESIINKLKTMWEEQSQKQNLDQAIKKSKIKHENTIQTFEKGANQEKLIHDISQLNRFKEVQKVNNIKTIIGIDCAASMPKVIKMVKENITEAKNQIKNMLQQKGILATFQNQIEICGNQHSEDLELDCPAFEFQGVRLKKQMFPAQANSGCHKSINSLLQHADTIPDLGQIFIIAECSSKREQLVEQDEAENVRLPKVKVFTFCITQQKNSKLAQYCRQVSEQTEGISIQFNIQQETLSEIFMARLIVQTQKLLKAAGREDRLAGLETK